MHRTIEAAIAASSGRAAAGEGGAGPSHRGARRGRRSSGAGSDSDRDASPAPLLPASQRGEGLVHSQLQQEGSPELGDLDDSDLEPDLDLSRYLSRSPSWDPESAAAAAAARSGRNRSSRAPGASSSRGAAATGAGPSRGGAGGRPPRPPSRTQQQQQPLRSGPPDGPLPLLVPAFLVEEGADLTTDVSEGEQAAGAGPAGVPAAAAGGGAAGGGYCSRSGFPPDESAESIQWSGRWVAGRVYVSCLAATECVCKPACGTAAMAAAGTAHTFAVAVQAYVHLGQVANSSSCAASAHCRTATASPLCQLTFKLRCAWSTSLCDRSVVAAVPGSTPTCWPP